MNAPVLTRIDWFRVIVDLERSGMSQADIGERIGRSQQMVNVYKTVPDAEPRFAVGMALLQLWQHRCNRGASAPTI